MSSCSASNCLIYVDEENADLCCLSCKKPLVNPWRITPCGHAICKLCFGNSVCCPFDGGSVEEFTADQPLSDLVDSLLVRCPRAQCQQTCERKQLASHIRNVHCKRFMLSGIKQKAKKAELVKRIRKLGGKVVVDVNEDWTRFIAERLTCCEKLYASLAGGKWILTERYVNESFLAGHWLLEDAHEWEGEKCNSKMEREIALRARYWRLQGGAAFPRWRCVLHTDGEDHFNRILQKGGATILPCSQTRQATHVFLDQNQCKQQLLTCLLPLCNDQQEEILYLHTDFIFVTLMKESPDSNCWKAVLLLKQPAKRQRSPPVIDPVPLHKKTCTSSEIISELSSSSSSSSSGGLTSTSSSSAPPPSPYSAQMTRLLGDMWES